MPRDRIDITGQWRFQPDAYDEGEKASYFDPSCDTAHWREVEVPCTFDACGPGMECYEGGGWFRRPVRVPDTWKGRRMVLRFEGANYRTRVWLNGKFCGGHGDGFLRFDLPVRDKINCGEENEIAVFVDNAKHKGDVPGHDIGWRPYGGILREVFLISTDPLHLADVRVMASPEGAAGKFELRARLVNEREDAAEAGLSVEIVDAQGRTCGSFSGSPGSIQAGGETEVRIEGTVPDAKPWSPDAPVLYTAKVELRAAGEAVDGVDIRFGFRRIEARDGRLLLNGEPVFLTGFNRHEDSPGKDMCTDLETARRDLVEMKRAGANFVRLCHYPHHPGEVDLCDELGLLVMGEIPLWQWKGLSDGEAVRAYKLVCAERQLESMILRDINHPSVIFWSVSNETKEDRPEVVKGNNDLLRLARELDPTRLAVHVSSYWHDHKDLRIGGVLRERPHFELDDVICVNWYPTWISHSWGRDIPFYKVDEPAQLWTSALDEIHKAFPDKPILVTEFGHPGLEGVSRNVFGEDTQGRAIEAEFRAMQAPYLCGATIWCYADHAWPGGRTSFYGVVTRDRRKPKALPTVEKMFKEKREGAR